MKVVQQPAERRGQTALVLDRRAEVHRVGPDSSHGRSTPMNPLFAFLPFGDRAGAAAPDRSRARSRSELWRRWKSGSSPPSPPDTRPLATSTAPRGDRCVVRGSTGRRRCGPHREPSSPGPVLGEAPTRRPRPCPGWALCATDSRPDNRISACANQKIHPPSTPPQGVAHALAARCHDGPACCAQKATTGRRVPFGQWSMTLGRRHERRRRVERHPVTAGLTDDSTAGPSTRRLATAVVLPAWTVRPSATTAISPRRERRADHHQLGPWDFERRRLGGDQASAEASKISRPGVGPDTTAGQGLGAANSSFHRRRRGRRCDLLRTGQPPDDERHRAR